jgi:hypothetical protein
MAKWKRLAILLYYRSKYHDFDTYELVVISLFSTGDKMPKYIFLKISYFEGFQLPKVREKR